MRLLLCAAFIAGVTAIAEARDGRQIVPLKVCIDGLTNLHVKDGQLSWEHLAFSPPGTHVGCEGVATTVDGAPWRDWSKSFALPVAHKSAALAFHPVQCRGNCVLVQSPSADNGWEAIYQFDDYVLGGSAIYCVNIVIGGPPESAAQQSVQHIDPAPHAKGGRLLFAGRGGKLRDGACAANVVSWATR